jgi:hypothetical protein
VATVTVPPPPIIVTVSPNPALVSTLGTQHFTAMVTGTANTAVSWSVEEGPVGGSITTTGDYTASGVPGTYHVRATSQDSNSYGTGPVTVSAGCMEAFPFITPQGTQTTFFTTGRFPVHVDSQGRPVVAWVEYAPFSTYVARLEAGAWHVLGAPFSVGSTNGGGAVDLAIDSQDAPVVAYELFNSTLGQSQIHVSRWNGTAWTDFGAIPQGSSNADQFSLALTAGDAPVVAFQNYVVGPPGNEIAVAAWNGTAWTETHGIYDMLNNGPYADAVFFPSLAIDAAGDFTVAWDEELNLGLAYAVFRPYAKKLSGPGAGLLPSPVTTDPFYAAAPQLAFDASGTLAMAYRVFPDQTPYVPSSGLQVARYSASWAALGPLVPDSDGTAFNPHRLILNKDSQQLAASTAATDSLTAAVYEYNPTLASWAMVCAPMPDYTQANDMAQQIDSTGLAYDSVHHAYVLSAGTINNTLNTRLFVARIKP